MPRMLQCGMPFDRQRTVRDDVRETVLATFSFSQFRSACAAIALTACLSPPALAQDAGGSFVDEFDRFDPDLWYASDGWNNGAHQNCTWSSRQIDLADGVLTLSFAPVPYKERQFSCGELQTKPRYAYGTYEARMRTGAGSGLNAAFFSYIGPAHKEPHDEIDFEVLLKDTAKVQVNTYVDGKQFNGALVDVEGGADTALHDYAFVWEPDRLSWYVDGKLLHETTPGATLPTHPQKIFFSIWGTDTLTEWMGRFDAPQAPVLLEVDRVAFTAQGDKCQFPESLVCKLAEGK